MTAILYGIPNCDTVKKARTWLDANGIDYRFHDFKKAGLSRDIVEGWLGQADWSVLVNRKGTTWRALDEVTKAEVVDAPAAAKVMLASPSVIKRPVLVLADATHVGFSDAMYQQIFPAGV